MRVSFLQMPPCAYGWVFNPSSFAPKRTTQDTKLWSKTWSWRSPGDQMFQSLVLTGAPSIRREVTFQVQSLGTFWEQISGLLDPGLLVFWQILGKPGGGHSHRTHDETVKGRRAQREMEARVTKEGFSLLRTAARARELRVLPAPEG